MDEGESGRELAFEEALAALESVVAELEAGELPLEHALAAFERGVALVRSLQDRLRAAEQRVQILTRGSDGRLHLRPVDEDDE
jgi:exodeoxyribonuclease VII small subunit